MSLMKQLMKAAINERYGSPEVVEIHAVPKPVPEPDEVLIKVCATTVTRTDSGMRTPYPFFARLFIGMFKPKTTNLGLDFAGVVEAVGNNVTSFKCGDRVFGMSPDKYGAHAEYLCTPAAGCIAKMPPGIDCIGSAALQLAKSYGAEVTSVVETRHIELVKSLGADYVIDFTNEDFSESEKAYDFVFDAVGKTSYSKCKKILKYKGTFSATDLGPFGQNIWLSLWSRIRGNRRVIFPLPTSSKAVIEFIKARMEAGELRAVIDSHYPLENIVEAYQRVDTEQKTGIVVIDVLESPHSEA